MAAARAGRQDGTISRPFWASYSRVVRRLAGTLVVALLAASCTDSSSGNPGAVTPTLETTPVPDPTPEPTTEERIRRVAQRVFLGTANTDGAPRKLRELAVLAASADQAYTVAIEFNADDNFTDRLRKLGIESDMRDAYKALFTSGLPISSVTVSAYFPLIDRFGNVQAGLVYRTALARSIAERINWQNAELIDWSRLWTVSFVHPEFR